jgi:hypothetical protein
MAEETEKRPGQWRFKAVRPGTIVNRPFRREVWGTAYAAQRCRLILDEPDIEGNESYSCKIADHSEGGFCVVCPAAEKAPDLFGVGVEMTLEAWDGKLLRVEIRWISNGRVGLKRYSEKFR